MTARHELLLEIANCAAAIKAFKIGCPWLAPSDLIDAPSIEWIEMHRKACQRQLKGV
jgi:hypothetical protein